MARLRERLSALKRVTPAVKGVDWVGRWEDIQTVWKGAGRAIKWILATGAALWGWIMDNPLVMVYGPIVVLLVIGLFSPVVFEMLREAQIWRRAEQRRLEAERKRLAGWGDLLPEMELLADSLQEERRDREGESIALLNRNRIALAEIARALAARNIPHPDRSPPHRKTEEWETFLWGFIHRVKAGDAAILPTLYEDVQKALERREYWRDGANLVRHYLQQTKDEESEDS